MDRELINTIISGLAFLTVLAQIASVVVLGMIGYVVISKPKKLPTLVSFTSSMSMGFAFLISLVATLGSLFLSYGAGFTPCEFCWFQRICMYPQVVILGLGIWKNDLGARKYALALSLIGVLFASYHYLLQKFPFLPCSDHIANCALKVFMYFGYITIPMMALSAFLLISLLMILSFVVEKRK